MRVFIETGLTLMDCYPVVEKWLAECRLNQYPDGLWRTLPRRTPPRLYDPHALYVGRAGAMPRFWCPMPCINAPGDRKILADNYEMMQQLVRLFAGARAADNR